MPTNLLNIPLVRVSFETGTEEDWLDSLAYFDASKKPLDLRGLSFGAMIRVRPDDAGARLVLSSDPTWDGIPRSGLLAAGGTDGNVLAWTVPASAMMTVPPGTYVIDVLACVLSRRVRIIEGSVRIVRGVTR